MNTTSRRFVGCLAVMLVACGRAPEAAAPEGASPEAPVADAAPGSLTATAEASEEAEPTTLAEAEALLDKARAELDRLALNDVADSSRASGAAGPSPAAAAPPSPAPRQEKHRNDKAATQEAEEAPKKEASTCDTACKAFSSLERASDAVCRLDTELGGKRCERAKQIRQDAARRITSCSCTR